MNTNSLILNVLIMGLEIAPWLAAGILAFLMVKCLQYRPFMHSVVLGLFAVCAIAGLVKLRDNIKMPVNRPVPVVSKSIEYNPETTTNIVVEAVLSEMVAEKIRKNNDENELTKLKFEKLIQQSKINKVERE